MRAADISLELKTLTPTGQARGRHEGKLVFAWGGLPGEHVTARILRRQRRSVNGLVTEVHTPSPARIAPRESHYLCCSPWQIATEAQELDWKETLVREVFEHSSGIVLPSFDVLTGELFGYRNKLEFSFTDTPDGLALAFFERGSYHQKLPLDGCLLGSPAINDAARSIRARLEARGITASRLKSLVLRSNRAGQVVAALYVTEAQERIFEPADVTPPIAGLRVFYSDPRTPAAVSTSLLQAHGNQVLEETLLGRTFRFSDRSFFQINIPVFEKALADIRRFAAPDLPLWDLYAGVGTIGICVGATNPVFVESDEETALFLRENCRLNDLPDPQILALPAEKAFADVPQESTVILDPPRAGLHPRVLKRLAESAPRRIAYLSCNPQTQARDIRSLQDRYQISFFRAYNFFPRTPHVETLAILDHSSRGPEP